MKNIFGLDSSPRTTAISRPFFITIACLVIIAVCVVWGTLGNRQYNKIMAQSSTPIGSMLKFSKSESEVELTGLYTDKNESALVARLTPTPEAHSTLPYRGTDYAVLVQSKAVEDYEEIPILFGKMSTDGDIFLILPKPTKEVYSFAIVNKRNLTSNAIELDKGSEEYDEKENGSVARSLSEFTNEIDRSGAGDGSVNMKDSKAGEDYDIAALRMTTDPAYDEDAFKPKKLDVELINPASHEFNFEGFFKTVYVESAIRSLTDRYNELEAIVAQNESLVEENEVRLRSNPNDSAAQERLDEAKSAVAASREQQQNAADRLTYYQTLKYDPSVFQDFQTSAFVANK